MLRALLAVTIVAALILSAGAAPGEAPASESEIDRLLDATGLKHQARLVAVQTADTLRGGLGTLGDEDRQRVEAITRWHFHPDAFYGGLRAEFGRHLDEARLGQTLAWYETPVGRRVAAAEVRFYAADRRQEVEDYVAGLLDNRPSPTRVALLQRLDAATGATEGSLELFVAVNRSIVRVVEPMLPPEQRIGAGQLESQARQIRLQMQEAMRQVNVLTMLFLYQHVSDDDVRAYIEFMESDAGAWYGTAARRAIVATIADTVERSTAELVRVVPPERWLGAGFTRPQIPTEKQRL